jgi:hypothetical protein
MFLLPFRCKWFLSWVRTFARYKLTVYLHLLSEVLYGVITDVQSSPVIRWSSGENDINHPGNPLHRPLNRGNLDDLINRRKKRCNIFPWTLDKAVYKVCQAIVLKGTG